ncbi:hypothetical protein [Streptomyces marianii]|uniref:Uncharacterized protein n=1 Tax=Streptomyces marianii TaxID=1817406 RepID=A0A5R9DT12_9ACTN|nr:hypothetical protein [Streptomyces marianii]TLQ39236.1 hypothetical protein FEF34_38205 [Streptomyces marianii]
MSQPGDPSGPVEEVIRLLESAAGPVNPMVLLVGPPLSGITRSMYEAVRSGLPHGRLYQLTVADLAARPDLEDLFSGIGPHVLWLDGLAPADLVLLGHGVLDQVLPHAMVLASVDAFWCDRVLRDGSAAIAPARTVLLEYADRIPVPFTLSPRERSRLREMGYPVSKGLAESLVGGENLIKHYRRGARSHPEGHRLVQAAIDARRCGIHRPFSEDELQRLWEARGGSPGAFQRALDWASAVPEGSTTGLLFRAHGGQSEDWRVLGYAAGADNGDHGHKARRLSDDAWKQARELFADAADQYALGIAAHLHGRDETARLALSRTVQVAPPQDPVAAAAAGALRSLEAEGSV